MVHFPPKKSNVSENTIIKNNQNNKLLEIYPAAKNGRIYSVFRHSSLIAAFFSVIRMYDNRFHTLIPDFEHFPRNLR